MKNLVALSISVLLILVCGCAWQASSGASAKGDLAAEKAAIAAGLAWLDLVDEGRYGRSWEEASTLFKTAMTRTEWEKAARAARTPLGKRVSRKLKSHQYATSLPGAPDGEYLVIQYETSFEHKTSAVETVTPMRDKDGKWRVSGYYIR